MFQRRGRCCFQHLRPNAASFVGLFTLYSELQGPLKDGRSVRFFHSDAEDGMTQTASGPF